MLELRRFLRIAHRGASGHCPENTRAAFLRAIELRADMVELDCQTTADGAVVVVHDETLDRTSNGKGPVSVRTLRELKALDAGSWFHPRFAGEEILTLEEALETLRGKASVNVELKGAGDGDRIELVCLGIVTDAGMLEQAVFSSFSRRSIRRIREISDEARIGVLLERHDSVVEALDVAETLGAEAIHPEREAIDRDVVELAHRRGRHVRAWPVNERRDLERLIGLGVDGIFTDFPDRLLRVAVPMEEG